MISTSDGEYTDEELEALAERLEHYGLDTRRDLAEIAAFFAGRGNRPSYAMKVLAKRIVVFESRLHIRAARSRRSATRLFSGQPAPSEPQPQSAEGKAHRSKGRHRNAQHAHAQRQGRLRSALQQRRAALYKRRKVPRLTVAEKRKLLARKNKK